MTNDKKREILCGLITFFPMKMSFFAKENVSDVFHDDFSFVEFLSILKF